MADTTTHKFTSLDIHIALQQLQQTVHTDKHNHTLLLQLQQYNNELVQHCYNTILLNVLQQVCNKHENGNKSTQYTYINQILTLHHTIQTYNITTENTAIYGLNIQTLLDAHNAANNSSKSITQQTLNSNSTHLSSGTLNEIYNELHVVVKLIYDILQPTHTELQELDSSITDMKSAQSVLQLTKYVLEHNTELHNQHIELQQQHQQLELQHVTQSATLLDTLVQLCTLLTTTQYCDNKVETELLMSKINALHAKSKRHRAQLLCETYNIDTLPILHQVNTNIDNQTVELNKRKIELQRQLNKYNSIGLGYSDIVKRYADIQSQIKKQQGILDQFVG